MKWYTVAIIVVITALIGFFSGWLVHWWNTPLGPHICIDGLQQALPGDYTRYWYAVGAVFAGLGLVVVIELGIIIAQLRKKCNL